MVAPIKDKSHSKNLTGTFERPKISLNCSKTGNFYNWKINAALVIPTLDCSISFDCMHAKDVDVLELCLSCTESLTLWCWIILKTYKHVFAFDITTPHWNVPSIWNPSKWKTGTFLSYKVMVVDGLEMQRAKASFSSYGNDLVSPSYSGISTRKVEDRWWLCKGCRCSEIMPLGIPSAISLPTIEINSLWPSDAIWRQRSGSTLIQVVACYLMAPSHYLNKCTYHQWGLVTFT